MEDLIKLIKHGADEEVKSILENQPNIKTRKNMKIFAKAAVEANSKDIIVTLLGHGLKINAALALVVDSGKEDLINFVLDQDADIIAGLSFAIESNKKDVITLLFAREESTIQSKGNTLLPKTLTQKRGVDLIKQFIEYRSKSKTSLEQMRKLVEENNKITLSDKLEKIRDLLNQNEYEFECITGSSNVYQGFSYQIKYLTLYAIMNTKRAISNGCHYELSTEVKKLVPFDDIYLKKFQNGRTTCEFVQVKQGKIELSEIFFTPKTANNLKEHLKGNESIMKMFIKFDKIINHPTYVGAITKFILCMGKTFQDNSAHCLINVGDSVDDSIEGDPLCGVKHNKWIIDTNYVFNEIKLILFNLINSSQYFNEYLKKMNEEFKNKFSKQIEILKNKNIALEGNMEDKKLWSVKEIAGEGFKALQKYKDYLSFCKKEIKKIREISAANIDEIKNNLPIDIEIPDTENLPSFKNTVLTKISELSKSFKIDNYCLFYFSKYDDIIIKEKLNNFANHFSIYTDCPSSKELDDLIRKEIIEEFKFAIPIHISELCKQHISEWIINFKNFKGNAFTDRDGKKLFHNIRISIFHMYNKSFIKELQKQDIFKQDNKRVRDFLCKKNNHKILHVITEHTRLHTINVWQTASKLVSKTYNIICTNSEYIFKLDESTQNLFEAYSSNDSKDLFILEFPNDIDNIQKVLAFSNYLKNIILLNKRIKIIIIATGDNKIATKLKCITVEYTSYHDVIKLTDLKINARKQILQKIVNFKNNPNSLSTYLKLQDFTTTTSVSSEIINEEILSILFNIADLEIGNGESFVSDHYIKELFIPRYVSSIDIKILENCVTNLFFVTGITKTDLISQLPQQEQYMDIWNESKTYKTGIKLISDEVTKRTNMTSTEIFTSLSRNSKKCYWLEFRNGFVYRVDTDLSNNHKFEEMLSKRAPESLDDKIVIIANNPGEGKSTMLTHLAHTLRNKSLNSWIIRIDLRYFADNKQPASLNNITFDVDDTIQAVEFMTLMAVKDNSVQNYKLERKLLHSSLSTSSKVEVVLLFDGFDEISPKYKEKTCTLIKALAKSNVAQLWVTTRVHLKEYLEKELEVPAHTLTRFIQSEQIKFVCKYWKWYLKSYKYTQDAAEEEIMIGILNQVRLLFNNFKGSAFDQDNELTNYKGSLLQLRHFIDDKLDFSSLAKLSLKLWEKTLKNKDFLENLLHLELLTKNSIQREWKLSNFPNLLLVTIYKDFEDNKFEIYKNRNIQNEENADLATVILRYLHHETAVTTLFESLDKQLLPYLNIYTKHKNFPVILARVGLVKCYNSRPEFIHRTFAEYFFSDYLNNHLDNKFVQSAFLEKVLLYDVYHMVRTFLDGFLLQSQLLSQSDRQQEENKEHRNNFKNIISRQVVEVIIKQKNNKNENILHVAVRGGHVQIFLLIFNNVTKNEFIKLVKTPSHGGPILHLALNEGHTDMFYIIVDCVKKSSRNQELELMKQINKGNMTILHTAAFFGNTEIFNKILKILKQDKDAIKKILMSSNVNGLTALHFAASEGNAKICDLIIETADEYSFFRNLATTCDIDRRTALLTSPTSSDNSSKTRPSKEQMSRNMSQGLHKSVPKITVQPSYRFVQTSMTRPGLSQEPMSKAMSQIPHKSKLKTNVQSYQSRPATRPAHQSVLTSLSQTLDRQINRANSQLPHKFRPKADVQPPYKLEITTIRPPYQTRLSTLTRSSSQSVPTATQLPRPLLKPRATSRPLQHFNPRVTTRPPHQRLVETTKQNHYSSTPRAIPHLQHQSMPMSTSQSQNHLAPESRARLPYQPMLRKSQVPQGNKAKTPQQLESRVRTQISLRPVYRANSQSAQSLLKSKQLLKVRIDESTSRLVKTNTAHSTAT